MQMTGQCLVIGGYSLHSSLIVPDNDHPIESDPHDLRDRQ